MGEELMNLVGSFEKNHVEFTESELPIFIKLFLYISCRLRITMFRPRPHWPIQMPQEKGYLIRENCNNFLKNYSSPDPLFVDVNQTVQSAETDIFTYHFYTLINNGKNLLELLHSYFV